MEIKESTKISIKLLFIVIGTMVPAVVGISKYIDDQVDGKIVPLQRQLDRLEIKIDRILLRAVK